MLVIDCKDCIEVEYNMNYKCRIVDKYIHTIETCPKTEEKVITNESTIIRQKE